MTIFPNINDVQIVPQRGPGIFPHQEAIFFSWDEAPAGLKAKKNSIQGGSVLILNHL